MRKHLILFTAIIFAAGTAFSQARPKKSTFASHISLGPVLSLGHSWVSDMPGNRDFKFSPAAGIGIVYSTDEHLGFGAQLLVSHEGYKQELPIGLNEVGDVTVNPVYLRMPLHVIYFFGKHGDRLRPKLYIGPSFATRIDETHHYSDSRLKPMEGTPAAADQFSRFDAGLSAGAGANIRLSKLTWLNLDLGYYHGLVDVISNKSLAAVPTAADGFDGNRNLRVSAGLMWGL